MRIGGTFNGTGAAVYICCGFVPDFVKVWNCEGTQALQLEWNKNMRSVEIQEGVELATSTFAANLVGAGIARYYGGETLTATTAGNTAYGEGVYLKRDARDYRYVTNSDLGIVGDAVGSTINKWTLDSAYNGHFNADVIGTYIGEGSPICIDGKWYTITALSAGTVTLNATGVPSGEVQYIGGMYDYKPMVAGEITPAGF
ncbi:MAG TPA: hypothetical protein PLK67_11885, partial [Bryobacteraceae bacterium]|nr:hypothetical protein [Bryobacteraceae bacterium]